MNTRRSGWRARRVLSWPCRPYVVIGMIVGLAGCSSIEPVPPAAQPIIDPTQLYMSATLDHPAVTMSVMAPYDTLQLRLIPRNALGNPMTGFPAATFKSSDTTSVRVSAEGLVTAVGVASGVRVVATLTAGPVTHADTALIDITANSTPPRLASLSIDPVPPDSGIWSALQAQNVNAFANVTRAALVLAGYLPSSGFPQLVPHLHDSTGSEVTGLQQIVYQSLDPVSATVDRRSGQVIPIRPGLVQVVAQTTAYGIAVADTATFTVTLPITQPIIIQSTGFDPKEIRIPPHGIASWYNNDVADSVDIVFDDAEQVAQLTQPPATVCLYAGLFGAHDLCAAGNTRVPPGGSGTFFAPNRAIQFPVPGIYSFHSDRLGNATGRIVVTTE